MCKELTHISFYQFFFSIPFLKNNYINELKKRKCILLALFVLNKQKTNFKIRCNGSSNNS